MAAPFVSDGFADGREFAEWCDAMRDLHGRGVSSFGVRVSWSPDELDPGNPGDVRRAMEYGVCLAGRFAPSMPVHVVAHGDGEGGCLHLHLEFANTDPETGRAFSGPRNHRALKRCADELAEEMSMNVLKEPKRGRGQTWAAKGIDPATSDFERELGGRVLAAYSAAAGVDDFKERLAASGIELVEVARREKGADGKRHDVIDPATGKPEVQGWRYVMRDPATGRKRRRKASALAPEFGMKPVTEELSRRAAEAERQRREAERRRRREAERKRLADAAAEQREREEAARDLNAIAAAVGERERERGFDPALMSLRLDLATMTPERFDGAFRESFAPGAAAGSREDQQAAQGASGTGIAASYGLAGAPASRRPSSATVSLLARLLALLREARLAARRLMRRDVTEGERRELARQCLRNALPEPPKPRRPEPQGEQVQEAVASVELPSRRNRDRQRQMQYHL